jgi:hypothetical protein
MFGTSSAYEKTGTREARSGSNTTTTTTTTTTMMMMMMMILIMEVFYYDDEPSGPTRTENCLHQIQSAEGYQYATTL